MSGHVCPDRGFSWYVEWSERSLALVAGDQSPTLGELFRDVECLEDLRGILTALPSVMAERLREQAGVPRDAEVIAVPAVADDLAPHEVVVGLQILASAISCDADNVLALAAAYVAGVADETDGPVVEGITAFQPVVFLLTLARAVLPRST